MKKEKYRGLSGFTRLGGLTGLVWLIGLLLASCSSDPEQTTPTTQPVEDITPIVFNASEAEETSITRAGSEPSTRSGSPLSEHVTFFKVYGFKNMACDDKENDNPEDDDYSDVQKVFPGYVVNWTSNSAGTSTTNTSGWEYVGQEPLGQLQQTVKYWDWIAKAYRFFGIAGATGTNEVTAVMITHNSGAANEYETYDVTYTADANKEASDPTAVPYYSHLWFSNGNTTQGFQAFGTTVSLQFIKPFSRVRFIFTFEDPSLASETELTEKSFAPTDGNTIKMKGDVTVSYPVSGTLTQETFSVDAEASGIPAFTQDYYTTVSKEGGNVVAPYLNAPETETNIIYTVLPATSQGTYTLSVNVNGDPKTAVVPAAFMEWKPGYQYTYIFKVHVDGSVEIETVETAFTDWTNLPATHMVYNW